MAHAGPSSAAARKPTKQKQKQSVKKTKKSVLGRQTVELLDKAALEYVRGRELVQFPVILIGAALGPARRPQDFLRLANIGSDEERVKEVFLR